MGMDEFNWAYATLQLKVKDRSLCHQPVQGGMTETGVAEGGSCKRGRAAQCGKGQLWNCTMARLHESSKFVRGQGQGSLNGGCAQIVGCKPIHTVFEHERLGRTLACERCLEAAWKV